MIIGSAGYPMISIARVRSKYDGYVDQIECGPRVLRDVRGGNEHFA